MPTTVVNPTKWALIGGAGSETFSTARQTGGSVFNNTPSDSSVSIKYTSLSGRGTRVHAFNRTFYYFDLSGVSNLANLTTASLDINGYVNADSKVIIVSSSAFGGDGSSNATTGEFFTSLDYSKPYTDTSGKQWATGTNTLDLNTANVENYLKSEPDAFIFAIIDYNNDYLNAISLSDLENYEGISFSDHASGVELTLVTETTTTIGNINGVAYNTNNRFNRVLFSDIGNLNGVT